MFKLQIILVPASVNRSFNYGLPSISSDSSQLILPPQQQQLQQQQQQVPHGSQSVNNFGGQSVGLDPNVSTNTAYVSSFMTSHITRPKLKKFLIFTKPTNTLYQLSQEILDKCNKIYPNLPPELEIDTLQDVDECDLDPDFIVKDVFNVFNTVRVILRNDVDLDNSASRTESLYSTKRRKLNNGNSAAPAAALSSISSTGNVLDQPVTVAKRRSQVLKNSALRISTPLAHQIYPPPSQRNQKQVNSDYEDDDYVEDELGDKSILPPPTVPQSPPIRISSSIGQKRLNINGYDDAVSKSETVDPSKSKQQRLPSGTPMKPINMVETPNKAGNISLPQQQQQNQGLLRINSTPVVTNQRITSGMLRIPEPRISEMERTMHEGLSSPAAGLLPPKSAKIPMKKPYVPEIDDSSSSDSGTNEINTRVVESGKPKDLMPLSSQGRAPSSIADDNGSPTKKSPLDHSKVTQVKVAELPQRKSSLEAKVEKLAKNASELITENNHISNNTTRKDGFSDSESESEESENDAANDTVRIRPAERTDGSFHKSDLLEILKGSKMDIPPGFKRVGSALQENDINKRSRKPYLTVLNKDIDNSEPDPRNILPSKIPRHAAQKAAQFISAGTSRKPLESSSSSSSAQSGEDSDSESGIETDHSTGNVDEVDLKKLNVHPLKPVVVPLEETQDDNTNISHNDSATRSDVLNDNLGQKETTGSNELSESSKPSQQKSDKVVGKNIELDNSQKDQMSPSKLINLKPVQSVKASTPAPSQELHEKIDRQLSPSPVRNRKDYVSPEFIDDSDDASEKQSPASTQNTQEKENTDPSSKASNTEADNKSDNKSRKMTPAMLKRKQEAEQRRLQREAARKAKQEEQERKRAAKEAAKKAKQEEAARKKAEREAAKKARQEQIARRKLAQENKKDKKESTALHRVNSVSSQTSPKLSQSSSPASDTDKKDIDNGKKAEVSGSSSQVSKLDELRSKFAGGKSSANEVINKIAVNPVKLQLSSKSTSTSSSVSETEESSDSGDSSSSSSSSEDEASMSKKIRRGIVDTPRGVVGSISKKNLEKDTSELRDAPQSTQQKTATPLKVPVTKIMDYASPAGKSNDNTVLVSPPRNSVKTTRQSLARNSLSSLSDLVSRGVPEVKEKPTSKAVPEPESSSSSDEGNDDEEISSDSDDDSDSSDSSDDDSGSNFINAKSASKALGKKKMDSGFSSLIKDLKRK